MDKIRDFLDFILIQTDDFNLHVYNILGVFLIFLLARFTLWLIRKYLNLKVNHGSLNEGNKYAIYQILSYLIYVIAILFAIDSIGIKITVLLAGSTALFVGLGLGLQDFFKDLVAGVIILSERTVTVGDIVNIGGTIGKVKEVGLRTTSLITRDDIVMIIPNNRLTSDNVVNWSQNKKTTRFHVSVGVAYGSDTAMVKQILLDCARENPQIKKNPAPAVFFNDFGSSSLDFSLYFFSDNLFRIERTKSDLRFEIDKQFRESKITIPFPQRDLWIKQMPNNS
jgi:small-conductance mechanosensitive channel